MGTTTTNLGLYKPTVGETGWGSLVDGNFQTLDNLGIAANVRYVHPSGSDANTGLSWAVPKQTILGAYDSLPSTGGEIYIAPNSNVGGEVANQGIWLVGGFDPNYASPPAGFRQQKAVHFIGVGDASGIQFGMPSAKINGGGYDLVNKPVIWLAGTSTPIRFSNLAMYYVNCGIRLGIASDMSTRDTNTSQVWFNNVNIACYNSHVGKSNPEPAVDIGYAFWIWFQHCVVAAYPGYPTPGDLDNDDWRCAFLLKPQPAGNGPGLVTIEDCTTSAAGVRYRMVGASSWSLRVKNLVMEGDFLTDAPPAVDIIGGGYGEVYLERIESADVGAGSRATIRVSENTPASSVVVMDGPVVDGPCTMVGGYAGRQFNENLASHRSMGFWNHSRIIGKHDASRRTFGFVSAVSPNLVQTDLALAGSFVGSATVTTGQLAPDGTSNAIKLTSASSRRDRQPYRGNHAFAVGDWDIIGVWCKGNGTAQVGTGELGFGVNPTGNVLWENGADAIQITLPSYGDGDWHWLCEARQVETVNVTPADTVFSLRCDVGKDRYYYGPVWMHVSAAVGLGASEVAELMYHLKAFSHTASQGQQSLLLGQSAHIPRGYIEMGEMTAPAAGATNYGRIYMEDNGSGKTRLVVKFPTGAAQVIATEP